MEKKTNNFRNLRWKIYLYKKKHVLPEKKHACLQVIPRVERNESKSCDSHYGNKFRLKIC